METLQYIIEDETIAYLLGVNNFINDESAILELVKNAYDAGAMHVKLTFSGQQLIVSDDGIGMDEQDIKNHWMHIGKSEKGYEIIDGNMQRRVLAGSKGVGRFALARLGTKIQLYSKKNGEKGVLWETNWNRSTLSVNDNLSCVGTCIVIAGLREKWGKKKIQDLYSFLSKTYNDDKMQIEISHPDCDRIVSQYFPSPKVGVNCLSSVQINYYSKSKELFVQIESDEFLDKASLYCENIDTTSHKLTVKMIDELDAFSEWDISNEELPETLEKIGDFSAQLYFYMKPTINDMQKFLYKYQGLPYPVPGGVVLYRNAFSISAYEGKKDWLGLNKRSRKSPAAASHPTGAWRVRENQISGKVIIDRETNSVLQDLSNRQGLDENIYYELFVEIIVTGIKQFERFRQEIIRRIDKKNQNNSIPATPISDKVIANPKAVRHLSTEEATQLSSEIKNYRNASKEAKKEKDHVEQRYKYDIRILNVLATVGLKASSIAHEMRNDRNSIAGNTDHIIAALKSYEMWETLNSAEYTSKIYKNVPFLLESNKAISIKMLAFMNTMLSEIEKKQFERTWRSIADILSRIKTAWLLDYKWITIITALDDDIVFYISEDIIQVILDNLILNSIQQNEDKNHLNIEISVKQEGELLSFKYSDNGKGLHNKYLDNPRKILEVHETTRKNGHGLGMWIVNNTAIMTGGGIDNISSIHGFSIEFSIGGAL